MDAASKIMVATAVLAYVAVLAMLVFYTALYVAVWYHSIPAVAWVINAGFGLVIIGGPIVWLRRSKR